MTTKTRTIRAAAATWALLDAEAERTGESANALAARILHDHLSGHRPETEPAPAPAPKGPPRRSATTVAAAPRSSEARAALASAEAAQGVRSARMVGAGVSVSKAVAAAGVMVYRGEKRPAYQKGQAGQGKAGRVMGRR